MRIKSQITLLAIVMIAISLPIAFGAWEIEQIESIYDDGMITETGGKFFISSWIEIKSSSLNLNSYFAFRGVNIPDNSKVLNASLQFTAPFPWNYNQSLPVTIYGLKVDDLDSWNPTPDLQSFPVTSENVVFDSAPLISGVSFNVSVTAIIQEIYDQYGWDDGNDLGFALASQAVSGGVRYQVAYDDNPLKSAKLFIEYGEGDNETEYYKGYTIISGGVDGEIPLLWENATADWNLCTYEDGIVLDQSQTGFTEIFTGSAPYSRDLGFKLAGEFYAFGESGGNLTLYKTADTGDTWSLVWTNATAKADINHFASFFDDSEDMVHVILGISKNAYYWNISLQTFKTGGLLYDLGGGAYTDFIGNVYVDMKESTNSLYVTVGTASVCMAYTQHGTGSLWVEQVIGRGTATGFPSIMLVDYNEVNDKVVWTMQVYGAEHFIVANVTDGSDPATKLDPQMKPFDYWKVMSYIPTVDRGHSLITKSNIFYICYARDYAGDERLIVDNWGYPMSGGVSHWDQANWTGNDQRYFNMYGDESNSDYPNVVVAVDTGGGWGMYDMPADFFQGSRSVVQWGLQNLFSRAGLIFNPNPPREPFQVSSLIILDPEGNPFNTSCTDSATTIEQIKACIDDYENSTDPFDPDPPASNYPEHESFGRFDIKYYIWIIGQVCIIAPCVAMAYRRFPFAYYYMFIIVILVGLGLLWSLSGM